SSYKDIIGPCDDKCSTAIIIDGHQKCRRRVCKYKDVVAQTDESEKLVIGCCRSSMPQSHYCVLHYDQRQPTEKLSSIAKSYKMHSKRHQLNKRNKKKGFKEGFRATGCQTNKAKSDEYVRRCSHSFGLIACVTNCRVFTSFGEIFRSETLREILHLLFFNDPRHSNHNLLTTAALKLNRNKIVEKIFILVAGTLPPAGCYDDGCHLVKYLRNHIGKDLKATDLKATDAAQILSNIKFSVDRTHFKYHVGKWCRPM
ncbi:unnamed protein product, partial [Rotaria magnacalcarata]